MATAVKAKKKGKKKAKKKAFDTKVYRYGLRPPIENEEIIEEQLSLRHKFDKRLTALELRRRSVSRQALLKFHPHIAQLEADVAEAKKTAEELDKELKAKRQAARKRIRAPELSAKLKEAKVKLAKLRAKLKAKSSAAWKVPDKIAALRTKVSKAYKKVPGGRRAKNKPPAVVALDKRLQAMEEAWREKDAFQELLYRIDQLFRRRFKIARAKSKLFWGTYLQVEDAHKGDKKGPPPKFRRWTGEGRLSAQVQKGMPVEAFMQGAASSVIRMDPLPEEAFTGTTTTYRVLGRSTLRMRVGYSKKKSDPGAIGAWPMTMHRPLPAGGRIKWAHVVRKMIGPKEKWQLHLNVDMPKGYRHPECVDTGMIAVHLSWRLRKEGGLRVGYMMNDKGQHNEIYMTEEEFSRFFVASNIRSERDKNFDVMRQIIHDWKSAHPDLPDWFVEESKYMLAWKAQRKLVNLIWLWSENRISGDERVFNEAEGWRKKDRELWIKESFSRESAQAWRLDWYRRLAADLRRRYRTILVPDFDLRRVATKQKTEDDGKETQTDAMRRRRMIAAPSELRMSMQQSGAVSVLVPCKYTTQTCHKCKKRCKWDAAAELVHTCEHCGATWDQDYNNCVNMLASAVAKAASR